MGKPRTIQEKKTYPIEQELKNMNSILDDHKISLAHIIGSLKRDHKLSPIEILDILSEHRDIADISTSYAPIAVFKNNLSCLEAIVKFLKENRHLKFNEISSILKRNQRSLWQTCRNAKNKVPGPLSVENSEFSFPLHIIHNKSLGVLEAIVTWLFEQKNLSYHQIALLLNRDDSTIWTAYNRKRNRQ